MLKKQMEETNLLNEYCKYHPEFLETFNLFPEREKIITELTNIKTKSQFKATVSELQFGKLFNHMGFEISYEKKYDKTKTPDWTIAINNEISICEIYRLGRSNIDQRRSEFQNLLIDKIEKIPLNYLIRISFIEEYFEMEKYDIDSIYTEINNWLLNSKPTENKCIVIQENFHIKIQKNKKAREHVKCLGILSSIDYKPDKVIQSKHLLRPNEISKKISKYKSIIEDNNIPYFIGICIDFVSGFDLSDFVGYFRGKEVEFIDYGKSSPHDKSPEIKELGKLWTELGVFYNNKNLSGLILRYNNEFHLLLNPIKTQNIYKNNSTLMKMKNLNNL